MSSSFLFVLCCLQVRGLIEESWLLVFNTKFTVNSSKDALYLTECKHATEERITCIIAFRLVTKHSHAMIDTHGQVGILFLKDAAEFNDVGTSTQVACLGEVAIGVRSECVVQTS